MNYGKGMSPWSANLMQRFVDIIANPRVPKGLQENAAIALGRLGLACPEQLAPHLGAFAEDFLSSIIEVESSEEKATAFKGFSMAVAQNPQAMEKSLKEYFTAIAQYEDMDLRSQVKQELHDILQDVSGAPRRGLALVANFLSLDPQHLQADDAPVWRLHWAATAARSAKPAEALLDIVL